MNLWLYQVDQSFAPDWKGAELICQFGLLNPKAFDNEDELDKAIYALQWKFKSALRAAWIKKVFFYRSLKSEKKARQETDKSMLFKTQSYENYFMAICIESDAKNSSME